MLPPAIRNEIAKLNDTSTIDGVEKLILDAIKNSPGKYKLVDCPLKNTITPALYSREIFMPMGTLVTSQLHKTEHQFVILEGKVTVVLMENGKVVSETLLKAGHVGITMPGTRRMLYCHTDVRWITFHSTLLTTVEEIEADIIQQYENPLLGGQMKQNKLIPNQINITEECHT